MCDGYHGFLEIGDKICGFLKGLKEMIVNYIRWQQSTMPSTSWQGKNAVVPLTEKPGPLFCPSRTFPEKMIMVFNDILITPRTFGGVELASSKQTFGCSGGTGHDISQRGTFKQAQ